jgi:hypothetical protein
MRSVLTLALGLVVAPATAQLPPAGDPFDVPSQVLGDQSRPDLDRAHDGRFVVVWEGPDGDQAGVFGRRFDAAGEPLGEQFQINVGTAGAQRRPRVAVQPQGGFLVVWESTAPPPLYDNVLYRAYDPAGVPRDVPRFVHTNSFDDQYGGEVAADSQGNFVVVWQTYTYYDPVYGRSFDPAGQPLGAAYRLDPEADWSTGVAVTATGPGEFVVAYETYEYYAGRQLVARSFGLDGGLDSEPVVIAAGDGQSHRDLQVAADAVGNLIVAWRQYSPRELWARRLDSVLDPRGEAFLVGDLYANSFGRASLAMAPSGHAAAVWLDATAALRATFLPRDGSAAEPFDLMPAWESGWDAAIGLDATGAPVVAWATWQDGSEFDVRARRFLGPPALFADGFERGNATAWAEP